MSYTLAYKGAEIDDILGRAAPGGAIDQALAAKQDALTFDAVPTEGSTNPAESGGIYDAIQAGGATALAAFATDTVSGDVVSFPDGANGIPVKSFVGSILPVQSGSGDPAPDNVRPISGWSGAEIYRTGKNLWNQARLLEATGVTYDSATGYYSGTSGNINQKFSQSTDGLLGDNLDWPQVAVSFYGYSMRTDSQSAFTIVFQYTDGTSSSILLNGGQTPRLYTGVSTAGKTIKKIHTNYASGSTVYLKDMQVEFGSTVTTYEPYDGQTIILSFGSTVYAGTITALGGGKWKVQPTHKIDALDSHTWNYGGNNRFNATGFSDMKQDALRSEYIYCSCYAPNVGGGAFDPFTIYNGTGGYVYVVDDRTTDGATLKETLLAGQKMVYPLATLPDPIIVSGEDLQTLLGANTVWLDCGSVTGMTYRADTALYIQKLLNGGGTLQTLSMASPSPSLSLGRVGVLAEPEVSEPEQTEEEAEQTERAEEE